MFLPVELIELILKQLYYRYDGRPDRTTLMACSLISFSWKDPSQQLLFRSMHLRGKRQNRPQSGLGELTNLFSHSARGELLGSHVRHLKINLNEVHNYRPSELLCIVSQFPKLYELDLQIFGTDSDSAIMEHIAAWDPSSKLPQLCALLLNGPLPGTSPLLFRLLTLWPTVQFLTFNKAPSIAPPVTSNLRLVHLSYHLPPSSDVLQWLIPQHTTSLQILQLRRTWNINSTLALVARQGTHLRSLEVYGLNEENQALLSLLPNLRELVIGSFERSIPPGVIDCVPRTIEHLRIRELSAVYLVHPESLWTLVNRLSRLRVVTIPRNRPISWWSMEITESWNDFECDCMNRGIVVERNIQSPQLDDNPVITGLFPRGRSVENFPLMN